MEFKDGVYTVLMTPFNEDGTIDWDSYNKLINTQINSEITGVVILGTTSEAPTLNEEEKMSLVHFVHKRINPTEKKLVIGIGGNNTLETIKFGREVADYCDYMMVTVPYYNKPSQEGIYQHFTEICSNETIVTKPIILYNIPSRTGVNMLPETVKRVCEINSNICAIKEASGSINQVMEILSICNIKVFSGDDSMTIPVMSVGGSGTISVVGNICPNNIKLVWNGCVENDYVNARNIYNSMTNLVKVLFIESNPIPGKIILNMMNIFKTSNVRLPLVQASNENRQIIKSVYEQIFSTTGESNVLNFN